MSFESNMMSKGLLSILGGTLTGLISLFGFFNLGLVLFPIPSFLDHPSTIKEIDMLVHCCAPMNAFLFVLLSAFVSSLLAGMVIASIDREKGFKSGIVVGGFFTTIGLALVITISHPLWFTIVSVLMYVPSLLLGVFMAKRFIYKT